jgi:hypothetical protein
MSKMCLRWSFFVKKLSFEYSLTFVKGHLQTKKYLSTGPNPNQLKLLLVGFELPQERDNYFIAINLLGPKFVVVHRFNCNPNFNRIRNYKNAFCSY